MAFKVAVGGATATTEGDPRRELDFSRDTACRMFGL
jgi:hypothetical protein